MSTLFEICQNKFGFRIYKSERIKLGWLNEKWILETDIGQLVLKKYHAKRYKDEETLITALRQQLRLCRAGVPSPMLLESDGALLHKTDSGDPYMLMHYCPGNLIRPGLANVSQMYDLGRVAGTMHQILNDGTLGNGQEPQFILPDREQRLAHWDTVINQAQELGKPHLLSVIERQKSMTQSLDIEKFRRHCRAGWAHRDLWMDNLLFEADHVSAVLDFDRLNYDYPEIDVARAILSGALNEDGLGIEQASAFLQGYRQFAAFPPGQLIHSIRLLWYLESEWWIRAEMDAFHAIPSRFASEMIWIASHHEELDEMLSGL